MISVSVVCVGKPERGAVEELVRRYEERCSRLCRFQSVEIKEARGDTARRLEAEAKAIEKAIKPGAYLVVLSEDGKQLSSEELADVLVYQGSRGKTVTFVIGSDAGLHPELIKTADLRLSLSRMTFPHQLARILLTEQIYRALTIISGHPYHRA